MKKVLVMVAVAALAGCSAQEQDAPPQATATATAGDQTAVADSAAADAPDAKAFDFSDSEESGGGERTFEYSWPAKVAAIPELAALLDKKRADALADQKKSHKESLEVCPPDAISCRNMSLDLEWQVVTDTPRFLSLSNSFDTYMGGAHGLNGKGSLVWDRQSGEALDPVDLFTSADALGKAIRPAACALLDKERAQRRGEPVPSGSSEWPNQCPELDETTVFLGSSNGKTFDRIGVYYGPYVAGAYAEGDFEYTVPVTKAVVDAAKQGYRSAFSIK